MPFSNFCCRNGGSNLNAGSRKGDSVEPGVAADLTYMAGAYVNSTRVFTVASGNPLTDGVAVNDFVALDTGSSAATMIAMVTARDATTITLSSTFAGTNPADGTYNLRVGGAWAGPSGSGSFPLSLSTFSVSRLKDLAGDYVRINLKNNKVYNVTAGMAPQTNTIMEGYSTSYGDGQRAEINGGTSGASYNLISSGSNINFVLRNLIFNNNGSSGSAAGILLSGGFELVESCVIKGMKGAGITFATNGNHTVRSTEITGNNTSNTASTGAVMNGGVSINLEQCCVHHNLGSNTVGVRLTGSQQCSFRECVVANNGFYGLALAGTMSVSIGYCLFYGNVDRGVVALNGGIFVAIDNSIFESNGQPGVTNASTTSYMRLRNCGFYGNGGAGQTTGTPMDISNQILSNSSFLNNPADGDYSGNVYAYGKGLFKMPETALTKTTLFYPPNIGPVCFIEVPPSIPVNLTEPVEVQDAQLISLPLLQTINPIIPIPN